MSVLKFIFSATIEILQSINDKYQALKQLRIF